MAQIQLTVVTPERVVIALDAYQVTLPIEGGEVTLLPQHMPYIGILKSGEIIVRTEPQGEEISLVTSGGFVEFHNNTLVLLADTAERAEEIDVVRAEEARKRAETVRQEKTHLSEEEYARTAALIEKEMARIKVARKHLSRRGISAESGTV